jgi:hypothetical protein
LPILLNINALSNEQKLPVKSLLDIADEVVKEGRADCVVDNQYLVKFQDADYDAVKSAITYKKTLGDLSKDLAIETSVAAELVSQYGRLHPEIPRQSIDALTITDYAYVRIEIPPGSKDAEMGKLIALPIKVYSDRDLRNVQFNVVVSNGLEVIDKPRSVFILPQSEDGYAEVVRVRGNIYGKQQITINLVGDDNGTAVRRSTQVQVQVHPKSPDLNVQLLSPPPQTTYFGKQFALNLQVSNVGQGEARSVRVSGLDRFESSLNVVQDIPDGTIIFPGASLQIAVVLSPIKTGDLNIDGLTLEYYDAEGRMSSKPIPSFSTKTMALQPDIKVRFSPPKATDFEDEISVEYTMTNAGLGISRNVTMKATPIQGAYLVRGALSRKIATLEQGREESGQFDFQVDSNVRDTYPIDKIELSYVDEEGSAHKIEMTAKELTTPPTPPTTVVVESSASQAAVAQVVQTTSTQEPRSSVTAAPSMPQPPLPQTPTTQSPPISPPIAPAVAEAKGQTPPAAVTQVTQAPEEPGKSALRFMNQTKDSFGTNYSSKKWLSILDESDQVIDLGVLGLDKNNHTQQGYLNLLLAIYDSKLEDYELEERIENDPYTQLMLKFLRMIKAKQKVDYDPNGSTYSTIKTMLEKLLVAGDASETKLDDGTRILSRKLSFTSITGDTVSLVRQTTVSPTRGAVDIEFIVAQ